MTDKTLQGRTAVVTGGSSGIGAATVEVLAGEGARVIVGYNAGQDRADALITRLLAQGHDAAHVAMHIPLDASDGHAALAADIAQRFGTVDILVNSAGFTRRIAHKDTETLTPALFASILGANVTGHYTLIRALLPLLKKSSDALVVNVSSVSAFTGSGSNMAYCAAKAALDAMTMSLARAHAPVRFLCVSPASVDTGFVEGRSRQELEQKAKDTPLGRVVTPQDVALAILGCATHLRTATGTRVVIDGGFTL